MIIHSRSSCRTVNNSDSYRTHDAAAASAITWTYRIVDRRPGDIEQVWADTSLANRELGWKAERGLEEMLASAWKWEQRYRKRSV